MGTDWNKWFGCEHPPALSTITLLECIWTDCPVDVQDEAHKIWQNMDFGNDHYYYKWDFQEDPYEYPIIAKYLADNNIDSGTKLLIHFWW